MLFYYPLILLAVTLVLFFLKDAVFKTWWRFAKWYIPIALILIAISPDTGGGFFIGFGGGYDREGMIWFTAGLFFVISILIMVIKSWRLRGKR